MLKKKVAILTIGLLLFPALIFAKPVYTEKESYQVEVTEDGHIQVRKATRVYKDGVEISKTYHRHVLEPGADTTEEVQKVKDIANAAWTKEVIDEYETKKAKREKNIKGLIK